MYKVLKPSNLFQVESAMPAGSRSDEFDSHCPSAAPEINSSGNSENWRVLLVAGERPVPRFNVIYIVAFQFSDHFIS